MPPLVDLFSASSKPMPMVDALPSQPLQFAATLVPLDPDTSLPTNLPKPRRQKEPIPTCFPAPPYHSRVGSTASLHEESSYRSSTNPRLAHEGTDEWMQEKIYRCGGDAMSTGTLDISRLGIQTLSTKIADLRDLVSTPLATSPQIDRDHYPARTKVFSRVSTAPATAGSFLNDPSRQRESASSLSSPSHLPPIRSSPAWNAPDRYLGEREALTPIKSHNHAMASDNVEHTLVGKNKGSRKSIERSKTGFAGSRSMQALPTQLFAAQNRLTTLPSALFEVTNLTVLTLRNNSLNALPAAIGELRNLKELNIANNAITELPSTILGLSLDLFISFPNPFLKQDSPEQQLCPLIRHYDSPVPRLRDICISLLISPRKPHDYPPLLDCYYWDPPRRGIPNPLLDAAVMHELIPNVCEKDLKSILQLFRSFSNEHARQRRQHPSQFHDFVDPFPRSYRAPPPDDASTNAYYYHCPSPRHLEMDAQASSPPSRHLFLHPAEERVEWREVFGAKNLPVRWKGCSPGCLAFLEMEEDWEFEGSGREDLYL